jgi:galactan endo-1,6-beta-galactosidase
MRRRTLLGSIVAAPLGAAVLGQTTTAEAAAASIDPRVDWGAWEGWGTSLCWWGKAHGNRDDLADVFFTRDTVQYQGTSLPGLGLNIARYNAGGCSTKPINGESMVRSPNIGDPRQIDGYWLDWFSADPSSASWNWYVDSAQRNLMWKARDRGVNRIELFSNSPMWWMCQNHNPSGAATGGDNLQTWNHQQHAVYLATVARYAHDHWGVDFTSVEPFNEPDGNWWKADGSQEGCHFEPATQRPVINYLRAELNSRDLGWMPIAASDSWGYDSALSTWNSFDSATRGNVGRINVHGYQQGGGRRDLLYSAAKAAGRKVWNSEYGESDASGMSLASNLNLDFRWLHPSAWVYWQVVDGGGWGLIQDLGGGTTGGVNPKYYVLAQYARHIRPGMHILDGGNGNTIAAYDPTSRKLVIVATNYGTAQYLDFDLAKFTKPSTDGAPIPRWSTITGGTERYQPHQDTTLQGTRFWSYFEPNTVQTFEVPDVTL